MKWFAKSTLILFGVLITNIPEKVWSTEEYVMLAGRGGYPPFVITELKDDTLVAVTGMVNDILTIFETRYPEYKRSYNKLPRARANKLMESGEAGVDLMLNSPKFVSEALRQHYTFSDTIFETEDVVITKKQSDIVYSTPKDLHGKTVGILRGYSYGEFDVLFEQEKIYARPVETHTQNINRLRLGRIDAYLGNIHVSPYYMKQLGIDMKLFKFSEIKLFKFSLAFLVKNSKPELLKDLNTIIRDLKESGRLTEIVDSYIK